VVNSDDKKRARLNLITHLLGRIPHKKVPYDKPDLPKHRKVSKDLKPRTRVRMVPEVF
jgi:hypothetical protein